MKMKTLIWLTALVVAASTTLTDEEHRFLNHFGDTKVDVQMPSSMLLKPEVLQQFARHWRPPATKCSYWWKLTFQS